MTTTSSAIHSFYSSIPTIFPSMLPTPIPLTPKSESENDPFLYLQHLESGTSSPMGSDDQDHDHDHEQRDHSQDEHHSHDEDVKTSSEGNSNSRGVSLDSNGNVKKGGKKNGGGSGNGIGGTPGGGQNSNQMRRDQNRIAQREFRMRKQQHVRFHSLCHLPLFRLCFFLLLLIRFWSRPNRSKT